LSHYCTQIETEVGGAFFPSNCEGFNKEGPIFAKFGANFAKAAANLGPPLIFLLKNTEPLPEIVNLANLA